MSVTLEELPIIQKELIKVKPADFFDQLELQNIPSFSTLFNLLSSIEGVDKARILACDVLAIWILRYTKAYKLVNPGHTNYITKENAKYLFQYITDFLDLRHGAFVNALKGLLSKLLDMVVHCFESKLIFQDWLNLVMSLSYTSGSIYYLTDSIAKNTDPRIIINNHPEYLKQCISIMWSEGLANQASKSYVTIYKSLYIKGNEKEWVATWNTSVVSGLRKPHLKQNILKFLLPQLFAVAPHSFKFFKFRSETDHHSENDIDLYIGVAKIGQDLALINSPLENISSFISQETFSSILTHQNPIYRIRAFAFLVGSPKYSLPIPKEIFQYLKNGKIVESFFNDHDNTDIRQEFYGIMRQFLFRIKDSSFSSNNQLQKLKKYNVQENDEKFVLYTSALSDNYDYLTYFIKFIQHNIKPGSRYPQTQLALQLLDVLISLGIDGNVTNIESLQNNKLTNKDKSQFPFNIPVFSDITIRELVDNITNDYEDIREMSVNILLSCPEKDLAKLTENNTLIEKALPIIFDLKGRKSEGGARIIQFLALVYKKLNPAKIISLCDLLFSKIEFAIKAPLQEEVPFNDRIQGIFTAMRLVFLSMDEKFFIDEHWSIFVSKVLKQYTRLWKNVKHILSNDREDFDEDEDKVVLNLSWKLVKESTSFLQVLLNLSKKCENLITRSDFFMVVEVVIDQLSSVYHRGAFSSVYPTFVSCCEWCLLQESEKDVPITWLKQNIALIEQKSQFISRRSGGLPFLITGILTAVKGDQRKQLMAYSMSELLRIASIPYIYDTEQKTDIPQVHAFNSIKHIFIDSSLSDTCVLYVKDSLKLALLNCNSDTWSIRNCAVMLFTALQNRLFGTKKLGKILPTVSAKLFFVKYTGVKDILENILIETLNSNSGLESVFPILNILTRLEETSIEESNLQDFENILYQYLDHKFWKIREMAARALAAILRPQEMVNKSKLFIKKSCPKYIKLNRKHGNLLAVYEIVKRIKINQLNVDTKQIEITLFENFHGFFNRSEFSWAPSKVYINILMELNSELNENLSNILGTTIINELEFDLIEGPRQLFLNSLVTLTLEGLHKGGHFEDLGNLVTLCIRSYNSYETQLACIEFVQKNLDTILGKINISSLFEDLWKIIKSDSWSLVKSKSLGLYQMLFYQIDRNLSDQKIEQMLEVCLQYTSIGKYSEDVNATSLEALGSLVATPSKENYQKNFIELVREYAKDNKPETVRISALRSLKFYLEKSLQVEKDTKYIAEAYLYLFQFLFDDDSDIRKEAESFLSKLMNLEYTHCGTMVSYKFTQVIPLKITSIQAKIIDELINKQPISNILNSLSSNNRKQVLFDIESTNLFKNKCDYHLLKLKMLEHYHMEDKILKQLHNKFMDDYQTLIEFIETEKLDGIVGWSKNEMIFESFLETILNMKFIRQYEDWNTQFENLNELMKNYQLHEYLRNLIKD